MIKAINTISLKSIPQAFLAFLIFREGGYGFTGEAVIWGFVSIASRLVPLWVSGKTDDSKYWLTRADEFNGLSWSVVGAVWLYVEYDSLPWLQVLLN